ncbi:hypothetical protein [Halomarina pelagica]|uniref:hypothetical protein n=1 Tax=Halomarina pelagica TaxID=2961599 RepID=UPI0020C49E1E|nr:hypothetical protein [Halomarina sp. BND7]
MDVEHGVGANLQGDRTLDGDVIALGFYVPRVGLLLSVGSVVVVWAWYILVARTLLRLGRPEGTTRSA